MKKEIIIIFVVCVLKLFVDIPSAEALWIETKDSQSGAYTTVLWCNMKNVSNNISQVVHIKIISHGDDVDYEFRDIHILNRHIGLIGMLMKHGWQLEYGIDPKDSVDIELFVEPRRNLTTFAYLYVCEKSKTWNMIKEQTGMEQFYREIYEKLKNCFYEKHNLQ